MIAPEIVPMWPRRPKPADQYLVPLTGQRTVRRGGRMASVAPILEVPSFYEPFAGVVALNRTDFQCAHDSVPTGSELVMVIASSEVPHRSQYSVLELQA